MMVIQGPTYLSVSTVVLTSQYIRRQMLINMYRLLISLVLLQLVTSNKWCEQHPNICTHKHHDYHKSHEKYRQFHELSWDVVRLSRKVQRACEGDVNTSESYEMDNYRFTVSFSNVTSEDITVKAKHRVLFIETKVNKGGIETSASVLKILPDFLNIHEGLWTFTNGELDISIPHNITLGVEVTKSCQTNIDESVITLPKQNIDLRFKKDTETTV
ncbi:unnamed protein product [Diatraea saccharalis]|uniref:Uncharacterized protein n=1 Tax=Diatraea saccharalis TaxID=40085 RepID=A0A9N9WK25_9NEOP|nr:unnamed protein product [Diatraea saccharalis]